MGFLWLLIYFQQPDTSKKLGNRMPYSPWYFSQDPIMSKASQLANKIGLENTRFNRPNELQFLSDGQVSPFSRIIKDGREVDGLPHVLMPEDFFKDSDQRDWVFNAELSLKGNPEQPDEANNYKSDLAGFLPNINEKFCKRKVIDHLKMDEIPKLQSDQSHLYKKRMINNGVNDYVVPQEPRPYLAHPALEDQPIGCFESFEGGEYIFYRFFYYR